MGGRIALHCLLEDNSNWKRAVIISAHTGLVKRKNNKSELKKITFSTKCDKQMGHVY